MSTNMSLHEPGCSNDTHRREDFISWPEYFMGLALLSAQRSKDERLQVGACIVNDDNKIISLGYNGMPLGRDDIFPWNDETKSYVRHAEMHAIMNTNANLKDCTIYVTMYPCVECAKLVLQSGIKKIIYLADTRAERKQYINSKKMLGSYVGAKSNSENKFVVEKYIPTRKRIELNFT